jgi:hypothetical protein
MGLNAVVNLVFWGYGSQRIWLFSHDAEVIQTWGVGEMVLE